MSSTPLFDAVSRRHDCATLAVPHRTATPVAPPAPAPTSPLSAPVSATRSALVPAALVAAIDDIPVRVASALPQVVSVRPEQFVLVEAVADAVTRAVVDAVAVELDRIHADGAVRV
ncbi:hypothetical protein BIU98_17365 [Curtobacterium sp. MMLR14_010]|uniref:hypothetical protein n=1 Tax=Curtobacterium sp. MMLR14_010 TaxID=1898743 RepID=UPI0008DDCF55|nr:hypothetical protein [Curtobacterium sp. MMLR14_010]OII36521.1 hypothetical protein BIU98_17365 [Curtobacterium sp. MMLR14_010]